MRTSEEFRSLAATLLASREPAHDKPAIEIVGEDLEPPEFAIADANLMRDVRLFHARIAEALESAVERLLCDVACDVLARELQLAPVDIERIVDNVLQRYSAEQPLQVRVHPEDAANLQCALPTVVDANLARGDAIVELRDGFIDASLGVRLEAVLRNVAI